MKLKNFKPKVSHDPKMSWGVLISLLVIVVLSIGAVVLWPHYQTHTKQQQVLNSYNYTYTTLDSYSLSGVQPGAGASFDKPIEFKSNLNTTKAPVADLSHPFGKDKVMIADMIASALPPSTPGSTAISKNDYAKILTDPSNPKYALVVKPLQNMVSQRLINLNVKFSNAKPLTTANLKENAWQIDFTTTQQPKQNLPLKKGTAIMAIGKNSTYYFMVDAINDNWDSNQNIWQKIINSIKIDQ